MKLGIMQPYFFPYLGYFQYMAAVDQFVFYDDVAFIKQGWINRNKLLVNGEAYLFSVPLQQISSYKSIRDTLIHIQRFSKWKVSWLKTIEQSYRKAVEFSEVFELIRGVVNEPVDNIGSLAEKSVREVFRFLEITQPLILSPDKFNNKHLQAQDRVLDICRQTGADIYINPIGGIDLYSRSVLKEKGIDLLFLKSILPVYEQFKMPWISSLSIIDVLMFNKKSHVREMLTSFELL